MITNHMINSLRDQGYRHLYHIRDVRNTTIRKQEWHAVEFFGFVNDDMFRWSAYINALQASHIRLTREDDDLIWSRNDNGGTYSPRLGYKVIREEEEFNEPKWWFKGMWKFK